MKNLSKSSTLNRFSGDIYTEAKVTIYDIYIYIKMYLYFDTNISEVINKMYRQKRKSR